MLLTKASKMTSEVEEATRSLRGLQPAVGKAFFGNFAQLRPAQTEAIPMILSGADTVIIAGTGSGKTEAMLAPVVSRLLDSLLNASGPVIAYVAPTRALVNDVQRRIAMPLRSLDIRCGIRHGERNDLDRVNKPHVLVTTPESLDVLISRNPELLANLAAVIVDEAHQLYNSERGMQLAIVMRRIEMSTGHPLQVVAASATVGDPHELWAFFRPGAVVQVSRDPAHRPIDAQVRIGLTRAKLCQVLARASASRPIKILVFAVSRRECDTLADTMREDGGFGEAVYAHHSTLSKDERARVEKDYLEQRRAICFATSTLELGIDIGDIDLVVLWGTAHGWESLTQRIGRGNRRAQRTEVLCVVPHDEDDGLVARLGYQAALRQVEQQDLYPGHAMEIYGAAAQQIVAVATSPGRGFVPASELRELLEPWPHLTKTSVDRILDALVAREYLKRHPVTNAYSADDQAHELVRQRQAWSNLPLSGRDIEVRDGTHVVGVVPANNQNALTEGETFLLAGRRYQVTQTAWDHISVKATKSSPTVKLAYQGGRPPVDPGLVESAWRLLAEDPARDVFPDLIGEELRSEVSGLSPADTQDAVPYCETAEGFAYATFAGHALNRLIPEYLGISTVAADDCVVVVEQMIDFARLPESLSGFGALLETFAPYETPQSLFQELLPGDLTRGAVLSSWRRFGANDHILRRIRRSTPKRAQEVARFLPRRRPPVH